MYTLIQTAKLNEIDPQACSFADTPFQDRRDPADPARQTPTLELDVRPPLPRPRVTAALGGGLRFAEWGDIFGEPKLSLMPPFTGTQLGASQTRNNGEPIDLLVR